MGEDEPIGDGRISNRQRGADGKQPEPPGNVPRARDQLARHCGSERGEDDG